jgi:hypothetical protein
VKKLFYAVLILGLLVVSLTVHGQSVIDQYGPKIPSEKRIEVTKYHFWQARFNGTKWSDEQKAFLEKAALDPLSIKYEEQAATRLFTSDQLKDVFFKIGSFDTSILKAMYHANVRSDKTVLLRSLARVLGNDACSHGRSDKPLRSLFTVLLSAVERGRGGVGERSDRSLRSRDGKRDLRTDRALYRGWSDVPAKEQTSRRSFCEIRSSTGHRKLRLLVWQFVQLVVL